MFEPFKIIPGYGNRFLATSKGEIYDTQNECYLKQNLYDDHYWVYLRGYRQYSVHKLVALAYHGHPPFKNANVHHDNLNPLDNTPENLVYLTQGVHSALHNMFDENKHEMIKKACSKVGKKYGAMNCKKTFSKPVLQFTLDGKFVNKYPSASEALRQLGISQSNISACCRGKRKSAGSYKWKFKTSSS